MVVSSTRLRAELATALGDVGFEVQIADAVTDMTRRLGSDDRMIVIIDDADGKWLRIVSEVKAAHPDAILVLLAAVDVAEEFLAAVCAGVAGFCSPGTGLDAIVRTVESVRQSGVAIPRSLVPALVEQVRHGHGHRIKTAAGPIEVTDRENDILQLLMQRRSTREMAETLFVSVGTVRFHVSTLLKKLGAVDREDAIALIERGRRS